MHLRGHGVGTSKISFAGERIGIYFLETGAVNRPSNVIYDRNNSAFAIIAENAIDWKDVFDSASWFHWTGITPAISANTAAECLRAVKIASEMGVPISTDLNFRKKLWKWGKPVQEVMEELVNYSDVIIANEEDAEKVFGIKAPESNITGGEVNFENYRFVCQKLLEKFPKAKKIAITLRSSVNANHNKWSGILYEGTTLYKSADYDITHIVDRVGGGDSFGAGLIYGLMNYKENQKALDFAVAASCLKHTIMGDFNLVSKEEVENLMQGDKSGRVNR
jgi:2-dehydro-3-deoxygluconokinase